MRALVSAISTCNQSPENVHEETAGRRNLANEQFTRRILKNRSQGLVIKIQTSCNLWEKSQGPNFGYQILVAAGQLAQLTIVVKEAVAAYFTNHTRGKITEENRRFIFSRSLIWKERPTYFKDVFTFSKTLIHYLKIHELVNVFSKK